jgi:PKD repeat protein
MKNVFVVFIAFFCLKTLHSQSQPFGRKCLTNIVEAHHAAQNPDGESREQFEQWISRKMTERPSVSRSIYTIPIIVHVIHEGEAVGTGRNIPYERVLSQVDVLNEDFRRMAGTPGFNNHPVGADAQIEFCLAEEDPDGNQLPEAGIHRVDANAIGLTVDPPFSERTIEEDIKPATIWDPYRYCNIWVLDLESITITLGYARFPTSSTVQGVPPPYGRDSNDGVVVNYDFFGRDNNLPNPRYNRGRSCTHEMGHWLGLVHIWGDANSCNATDYCDDTPPAADSHNDCPTGAESCGSADMYENYMDYTDDECMNVFTNCQVLRMRTVMENSPRRKELLNSTVCSPFSLPPAADFDQSRKSGCRGLVVQFEDKSSQRPETYQWQFPGGEPSSSTLRNPRVTYKNKGVYAVKLKVSNAFGSDSLLKEGLITVGTFETPSFFFYEDFEGDIDDWRIENPDGELGWELAQGIGGSKNDQHAVGVLCHGYDARGQRDQLITPPINLTGKSDVLLEFDHAYRSVGTAFVDSFYVRLSTDGGQSFPHLLAALAETGQRTWATNGSLTGAFTPVRDADWCYEGIDWTFCNEIDLRDFEGEENVKIMFEVVNDNGNNVFIDNVRLSGGCAGEEQAFFDLSPNPARLEDREVKLSFLEEEAATIQVEIFDLAGKRVGKLNLDVPPGFSEQRLSLSQLRAGTYIVRAIKGEETGARKLVLLD